MVEAQSWDTVWKCGEWIVLSGSPAIQNQCAILSLRWKILSLALDTGSVWQLLTVQGLETLSSFHKLLHWVRTVRSSSTCEELVD